MLKLTVSIYPMSTIVRHLLLTSMQNVTTVSSLTQPTSKQINSYSQCRGIDSSLNFCSGKGRIVFSGSHATSSLNDGRYKLYLISISSYISNTNRSGAPVYLCP